jgi:hypothetical protein
VKVTVSVSAQQADWLDQLAEQGMIGTNRADVARRFIDDALVAALRDPFYKLQRDRTTDPSDTNNA